MPLERLLVGLLLQKEFSTAKQLLKRPSANNQDEAARDWSRPFRNLRATCLVTYVPRGFASASADATVHRYEEKTCTA